MKALFIGGTGTISSAITRLIAQSHEWELYLLNRGTRNNELPQNVRTISRLQRNTKRLHRRLC
ncbi:MAG: hypothetical protein MJZ41_16915 [Bacteroidaceae bacterium]|nr:hypothetical protein [Bacteroidaceae bacterium]